MELWILDMWQIWGTTEAKCYRVLMWACRIKSRWAIIKLLLLIRLSLYLPGEIIVNYRTSVVTEWVAQKALLLLLHKELAVMASTCSQQTSMISIRMYNSSPSHLTAPEVVTKYPITTNPTIKLPKRINNRCKSFCSNKWRPTTRMGQTRKTVKNLSQSKWIIIPPVPSANRSRDIKDKDRAKEPQLILITFIQVANRVHKN